MSEKHAYCDKDGICIHPIDRGSYKTICSLPESDPTHSVPAAAPEAPKWQDGDCPMCEPETCPGGAHRHALAEDGIRTREQYLALKASSPVPVAPAEPVSERAINALNWLKEHTEGEARAYVEVLSCQMEALWNQRMEPEKIAPEAISAPIPDDLKTLESLRCTLVRDYGDREAGHVLHLIDKMRLQNASLEAENDTARKKIEELTGTYNSLFDCAKEMSQQLSALKESHAELMRIVEQLRVCRECHHTRVAHCNLHGNVWECSECLCRNFTEEDEADDITHAALARAREVRK